MSDDPLDTHICNEDCPPVGVAGAVPTGQRMPEIRVIPEHYFDVAAEAWAGVQGDQIDAMDDQLRAAVGAVLDLVDDAPAGELAEAQAAADRLRLGLARVVEHLTDIDHPAYQAYLRWLRGDDTARVVDVDSLATDEDIYLIAARAWEQVIDGFREFPSETGIEHRATIRQAKEEFRAAIDAARDHEFHRALPELARLSALELDTYSDRKQALADLAAARADADSDRRAYLVQVERLIAERDAARADLEKTYRELLETAEQRLRAKGRLAEVNGELVEVRQQVQRVSDLAEGWSAVVPEGTIAVRQYGKSRAMAGREILRALEGKD